MTKVYWKSGQAPCVSFTRQTRQETRPDKLILLFCKASLTESGKPGSTSLPSLPLYNLFPKKLRRVPSEPLALPAVQLQTILSVIQAASLCPFSQGPSHLLLHLALLGGFSNICVNCILQQLYGFYLFKIKDNSSSTSNSQSSLLKSCPNLLLQFYSQCYYFSSIPSNHNLTIQAIAQTLQ